MREGSARRDSMRGKVVGGWGGRIYCETYEVADDAGASTTPPVVILYLILILPTDQVCIIPSHSLVLGGRED